MPRRRKALIFLTALLATTFSFVSFASAHTDNVTVLHITAVQVEAHLVDATPTGGPPSLGDALYPATTCSATATGSASTACCAPSSASSTPQAPSTAWSPPAWAVTS